MAIKFFKHHRLLWAGAAGLVAVVVLAGALYHHHKSGKTGSSGLSQTVKQAYSNPDQAAPASVVSNPEPNANSDVPGGSTGSNNGSQVTLAAPTGTFVNNHFVDLGSSDRNNEQSTCTTSAGATCQIFFTKQGTSTTKSLAAKQVTDASEKDSSQRSATWAIWTPASLGLSPGKWEIKAVATLGGQTKTTTSDQLLEVSQ